MFQEAQSFYPDVSKWIVSNVIVTTMMFDHATSFNQSLSRWDTSMTHMSGMFQGARSFTQDISEWIVSNVIGMAGCLV
jgi:surface protein